MRTAASWIAGVDVGASGMRIAIRTPAGRFDNTTSDPLPRLDGHVDIGALVALIAAHLRGRAGYEAFDAVTLGMAGFPELVRSSRELAEALAGRVGASRVVLAGDAITAHVGALGRRPGTVVAAGTGVVAVGLDGRGAWHRVDGWGLLLGDEGGGAWIGRAGLVAALRAADGRSDGSAALLDAIETSYGTTDDLVRAIYGAPSPSPLLGGFAPLVAAAASAGDAVASRIWRRAGELLARAALAASFATEGGDEDRYSWTGGVFAAGDLILTPFAETILASRPHATLTPPLGTPVDGALRLAADADLVSQLPLIEVRDLPR